MGFQTILAIINLILLNFGMVLYFLKHRYVFKAPSIEALAISSTKTNKGRP